MSDKYTPPLNTPVRVLAVEWREPWEFDHPTVLLEPVVRYSPNGIQAESLARDVLDDIVIDRDTGKPTPMGPHPADLKEFAWRGWSFDEIRSVAEDAVRGKHAKLGLGRVTVHEEWVEFYIEGDVTYWREAASLRFTRDELREMARTSEPPPGFWDLPPTPPTHDLWEWSVCGACGEEICFGTCPSYAEFERKLLEDKGKRNPD